MALCRSRKGAWIEIYRAYAYRGSPGVAPARERGLKSLITLSQWETGKVAPVRERGLKYLKNANEAQQARSLP